MKNILNIINFVRQNEPREARDIDLPGTTRRQMEEMRARKLKGTFLLQYDALIDPEFAEMFEGCEFELGLWLVFHPMCSQPCLLNKEVGKERACNLK